MQIRLISGAYFYLIHTLYTNDYTPSLSGMMKKKLEYITHNGVHRYEQIIKMPFITEVKTIKGKRYKVRCSRRTKTVETIKEAKELMKDWEPLGRKTHCTIRTKNPTGISGISISTAKRGLMVYPRLTISYGKSKGPQTIYIHNKSEQEISIHKKRNRFKKSPL